MCPDAITAPLHTYPDSELKDKRVSRYSFWLDTRWHFYNPTPGAANQASTINWKIPLCDDQLLTNEEWLPLLSASKRLVWSLYTDRQTKHELKPGTLGQLAVGLRPLLRWMSECGYKHFACLTPLAVDSFIDWIIDQTTEAERRSALPISRVEKPLNIVMYIWHQADVLEHCDQHVPLRDPLEGFSPRRIAQDVCKNPEARLPPIPDRFAFPIMHTALFYIGQPADDVIDLQNRYLHARGDISGQTTTSDRKTNSRKARKAIKDYRFSDVIGNGQPWHSPITTTYKETLRQTSSKREPAVELRSLILDISAAAQIIIQSCVGMRASELCAIEAGWNNDLPSCISIENTQDGLMEIFYLHSKVSKGRPSPEPAKWVIGSRPSGATYLPPPVRALVVLQTLYEPWRTLGGRQELICSLSTPHGLPHQKESIGPTYTDKLSYWQKSFIAFSVKFDACTTDMSYSAIDAEDVDTFIAHFRPHQWRKTFAQYLFRVNSQLLRALSRHFKHMNVAITEKGYIGTSSELVTDIMSERSRLASQYLFDISSGKTQAYGPLARLVRKHIQTTLDAGGSTEKAATELSEEARRSGIRINGAAHGKCFVSLFPTSSECHIAAGTTSWTAVEPNFETRTPSLCLGCACFATDPDHINFWETRAVEYKQSLVDGADSLSYEAKSVIYQRMRQAQAVLNVLRGNTSDE